MYGKDFRSYINAMDSKERRIFLHGFLTAADAFGVSRPLYDDQEAQKWALNQLVLHAIHEDDKKREAAQLLLNTFTYDKQEFRTMILHSQVNDEGCDVDMVGNPTSSPVDRSSFVAILPDGREIDESAYDALSEEEQRACKKVRYIEMKNINTGIVWPAREDELYLMQEMLTRDILIGDPINNRYNEEVFFEDGALHHLYCGSVAVALAEYRQELSAMYSTDGTETTAQHATRPYAFSEGDDLSQQPQHQHDNPLRDTMVPKSYRAGFPPRACIRAQIKQTHTLPQPYMQSAHISGSDETGRNADTPAGPSSDPQ